MDDSELQFLKDLLHSPGPSGYEAKIQKVVRGFAEGFADDVSTDWHGNVTAAVNPKGSPRIMLAGHCDQIGFLVQHVDEMGFLRLSPVGGWDVQMLIGQRLVVWTEGGPINGVVARKAIHLLSEEERKQVPKLHELWLDIGARGEAEARELVRIGDPVTLELGFHPMRNGLASAPGMDDRVGVWVVMDALRQLARMNPKAAVFAVSTVAEEIGLRGAQTAAYRIDPQIGIAVDVAHATDCPGIDQNQYGRVQVGEGPIISRGPNANPVLYDRLAALAHEHDIPVQSRALAKAASNDGNVMQISRAGVATGLIGIPNRYMHSPVEVVALSDLTNAAKLIALFCASVDASTDMTPRA